MSYTIDGQNYTMSKAVPLTAPSDTLSNFVAKVVLTDTDINANANSDYSDLRFTTGADGSGLCYHDFRGGTTAGGTAIFQVQVPSLTTGTNQIYVWFGAPAQTAMSAANQAKTWGNGSTFVSSLHFDETGSPSTWADATSNANNATNYSATPYASGVINGAISFAAASSQYITIPQYDFGTGDFAIFLSHNLISRVSSYPVLFGNYNSWGAGALAIFAGHASSTTTKYQVAANGTFPAILSSSNIVYGSWQRLALVRASGVFTLYINNSSKGTWSSSFDVCGAGSNIAISQSLDSGSGFLNGYVDENYYYKGTISTAWVAYDNTTINSATGAVSGSLTWNTGHLTAKQKAAMFL